MRLHYHHLYRLWDLLITATMAFVAIEVPEHFVLEYNITAHPVIYWLVTLALCVDVFVQWYRLAPRLVSPAEYSLRWAISPDIRWFLVDLVAAIPFRVLPGGALFELLRLLKLARVAQLMRRWGRQAVQNAQILRLVFFVCWLLITAHWLACGWLAIGGIDLDAHDAGASGPKSAVRVNVGGQVGKVISGGVAIKTHVHRDADSGGIPPRLERNHQIVVDAGYGAEGD